MTGLRIVLGGVGVLLVGYGAARLLHGLPLGTLLVLGAWLLVALLLTAAGRGAVARAGGDGR